MIMTIDNDNNYNDTDTYIQSDNDSGSIFI